MRTSQVSSAGMARRRQVSAIADGLNWLEIEVESLERSLEFWDPFLTRVGYVGSDSWSHGRSYSLGTNRVLFLQVGTDDERPVSARASEHPRLRFEAESRSGFKDITTRLFEAGLLVRHGAPDGAPADAVFVEAPSGMLVELTAPKSKPA